MHHLNCGSMCPISKAAFNGRGSWTERGELVCHCLLIETEAGLVLVDTGIGTDQVRKRKLNPALDFFAPPAYQKAETAFAQVQALGFSPEDVRHIIITHLDLDHAGALADFPQAKVHLHRSEHQHVVKRPGLAEKLRYVPGLWKHSVKWQTYEPQGDKWQGFEAVRGLVGLPEDILLVPLTGHSHGHSGVAVKTDSGWLLHCGDAYYDPRQLQKGLPYCPPGLMALQLLESSNHLSWAYNLLRLGKLKHSEADIRLFCSHDAEEYKALKT